MRDNFETEEQGGELEEGDADGYEGEAELEEVEPTKEEDTVGCFALDVIYN